MASARNNRIQERRAALREQQKRERTAADAAFKALDDEYDARIAAARAVAAVVELSGRERAGILLDLEAKDITAYVKLLEDLDSATGSDGQGEEEEKPETSGQGTGSAASRGSDGNDAGNAPEGDGESDASDEGTKSASAEIPSQGEPKPASASV